MKSQEAELSPVVKLLLEVGPLGIFFLANTRSEIFANLFKNIGLYHPVFDGEPIFIATAVFMLAMAIALIVHYILVKHLPVMPLVSGAVVLVFGGLTLYLNNDTFIKMKPTIVNILFGGVLLGGYAFGKYFLEYVFGSAFKLKQEGWRILTYRWGIFFLLLAVLNEIIWRNFSTDFWVNFKVFGVMPLTVIFSIFQMKIVMAYNLDTKPTDDIK